MNKNTKVRIATRGSQLALWQANYVADLLQGQGLESELQIIKTQGDRVQDRFLHEMGGKGLFVRELEEAMRRHEADLAVHSLKDLPAKTPKGFVLPAILKRHLPHDVIIFHPRRKNIGSGLIGAQELAGLGPLKIATASLRRQSLLKGLKSGIELLPIRGNVDTRIRKLEESDWDALILAGASIERLGLTHLPHRLIDTNWFVPCAAQGALAIETCDDSPFQNKIAALKDPETFACATLERKILELLGGDCTMPFGAYACFDATSKKTKIQAVVLDYEGQELRVTMIKESTPQSLDIEQCAGEILRAFEAKGVNDLLKKLAQESPTLGSLT